MLRGNKGDWSEIYAFFKLLSEQRLFAGDSDLHKMEELFYPIVKIIRNEGGANFEYELSGDVVVISGGLEELRVPIQTFTEQSVKLLSEIKKAKRTFSIPEIEDFMASISCSTLKEKQKSKADIRIVIHDQKTNQTADLGFSIKSQLGSDATIFNAAITTNFIYQIVGFNPTLAEIESINGINTKSKIKDRIKAIVEKGGYLKYETVDNDVFKENLRFIDPSLSDILAEIVKTFFTSHLNSVRDLTDHLNQTNPLPDDTPPGQFYEDKMKHLLTDVILGMTSAKEWNGTYTATGGYLIVKENGDVLCYHIYDKNRFEDYLYANTRLETASSSKHKFGEIYQSNGRFYFKLNLQIRFK